MLRRSVSANAALGSPWVCPGAAPKSAKFALDAPLAWTKVVPASFRSRVKVAPEAPRSWPGAAPEPPQSRHGAAALVDAVTAKRDAVIPVATPHAADPFVCGLGAPKLP